MANQDTIFGARLVGHLYGSADNARVSSYTVPATDIVALFLGDFVTHEGTSALGDDGENHPVVAQAEATDTIVGVVVGFFASREFENQNYRTASTLRTVFVCDDPYATFEIQSDGVGDVGDVGSNAEITVGTGSTVFGTSGMELQESSVTASTAQLRILEFSPRPDNEIGLNTDFICMINEHQYKTTAGV